MKIKNYIIHLLGGYTEEEVSRRQSENFERGKKMFAIEAKYYLDHLNGTPADEWCKLAYEYIKNKAEL